MTDDDPELADVQLDPDGDDRWTLVFVRRLRHAPERVWGALVDPEQLARWAPFDAPRDLVFKVWTDPEHLAQGWGPHRFTNPRCEFDARPGGAILIHMRGKAARKSANLRRETPGDRRHGVC